MIQESSDLIADIGSYFIEWLDGQEKLPTAHYLAEHFNITIELSPGNPIRGQLYLRSEYSGDPPGITIYQKAIESWQKELKKTIKGSRIHQDLLIEICLFHELCHHFLVYPAALFPQYFLKEIRKLKRNEEEKLIQNMVRNWFLRRYPNYQTELDLLIPN